MPTLTSTELEFKLLTPVAFMDDTDPAAADDADEDEVDEDEDEEDEDADDADDDKEEAAV
jgi:hypothetical protein